MSTGKVTTRHARVSMRPAKACEPPPPLGPPLTPREAAARPVASGVGVGLSTGWGLASPALPRKRRWPAAGQELGLRPGQKAALNRSAGPRENFTTRAAYRGPVSVASGGRNANPSSCPCLDTARAGLLHSAQRGRGEAGYRAGLSSRRPRVQVPSLPLFFSSKMQGFIGDAPSRKVSAGGGIAARIALFGL